MPAILLHTIKERLYFTTVEVSRAGGIHPSHIAAGGPRAAAPKPKQNDNDTQKLFAYEGMQVKENRQK